MQRDTTDMGLGGLGKATTDGSATIEALVDALGTAYSTFTLYEDPRPNEAFVRSIATLGRAPAYPWRAEVGVDGFTIDGEPVAIRREGSIRLSRGLFGLGVAALELISPPSADDLLHLLRLTALDDEPGHPDGMLLRAGVTSIRLLDRAMLIAGEDGDPRAGTPETSTLGLEEDSPAAFVLAMLQDGDDPATVARRFVEEYERSHLLIDIDDTWGTEEMIHAFVDGFWYLPEAHRAEIFSLMLERGEREENTAFLDQFGGMELAQMNRMFGTGGHPLLAEYLRVAGDEGGRHPDDVGGLAADGGPGSLTSQIVGQVASVLHAREAAGPSHRETAIDRLNEDHPTDIDRHSSTTNLLRGLLSLAAGTDRFGTTAGTWAGRVAAALSVGDLQAADDWLGAIGGLDLGGKSRGIVTRALSTSMSGDAVDALARLLTGPPPDGPGAVCRKAAPLFAADALIAELGDEDRPGRRKALLKALQVVARLRPQDLLSHLDDGRWFVVRNVVIALGTSQRPDVAGRLAPLAEHGDHRVRLEALRAIYRLQGDGAVDILFDRLADRDESVAAEAARLMSGIGNPGLDRRLILAAGSAEVTEAEAAVAALCRRSTPEAIAAVRRIARRPFAMGRRRRLRAAARRALEAAK